MQFAKWGDARAIASVSGEEKRNAAHELGGNFEKASPISGKGLVNGATGVAAAVANAVFHAIAKRIRDLPITLEKLIA